MMSDRKGVRRVDVNRDVRTLAMATEWHYDPIEASSALNNLIGEDVPAAYGRKWASYRVIAIQEAQIIYRLDFVAGRPELAYAYAATLRVEPRPTA